jgi:hypothetical protein
MVGILCQRLIKLKIPLLRTDKRAIYCLAKSPFVLLALGLWILVCTASLAEDDDPNALNQQVEQLINQGKYREAIPIAERAVEVAKALGVRSSPKPPKL